MKSGATCIAYETVTSRTRRAAAAEADVAKSRAACRSRSAPIISRRSRAAAACCSAACPGVAPAQGRDPRRRRRRRQRGADGGRHARRRHHLRHHQRPAGRARHVLRQPDQDRLCLARRRSPHAVDEGRAGDRRGAGPRRGGAQAGHPRDAEDDEARLGAGRHRDRPGRLLRDQPRRPPTPIRSTRSTASSIIASPTCRARSRAPRPSRSTMRPCRSC